MFDLIYIGFKFDLSSTVELNPFASIGSFDRRDLCSLGNYSHVKIDVSPVVNYSVPFN